MTCTSGNTMDRHTDKEYLGTKVTTGDVECLVLKYGGGGMYVMHEKTSAQQPGAQVELRMMLQKMAGEDGGRRWRHASTERFVEKRRRKMS
jgi:hypothetical protein